MRGILVAVACALVMGGCGCSETLLEGNLGSPDVCGNGEVEATEQCDDGNDEDCDGCSSLCEWEQAVRIEDDVPGAIVEFVDLPSMSCPYTIEAWYRIDILGGTLELFDLPGVLRFGVGLGGGGLDHPGFGSSFEFDYMEPVPGIWHHAAVVCGRDPILGWRIYVVHDGSTYSAGGETRSDPPVWEREGPLFIGGDHDWPGYEGLIDDVRISNEALYPYDTTSIIEPDRYLQVLPSTVALWNFNQEVDGVIPDISGNGHHAEMVTGTLVPDGCHLP